MPFIADRMADNAARQPQNDIPSDAMYAAATPGRINAALVRDRLSRNIFGQKDAIDAVFRTLTVVQAGLTDGSRPLASHLLVGPTGTGKTELVRQVAAALRTGPDDFCRVDMSALAQEHYAASFAGAPPGYAGSKEGLSLFDRTKIEGTVTMPGIVLFDEVEKAHVAVLRALLHVLDRGLLTLANGQQTFNFRNCLVFLTSNLGSRELRREQDAPWHRLGRSAARATPQVVRDRLDGLLDNRLDRLTQDAVAAFFDPELFNRIDEVTVFNELAPDTAVAVAQHELTQFAKASGKRGVELTVADGVAEHLVGEGFDPIYGARSVRRAIRHQVWPVVARTVIEHCAARAEPTDQTPTATSATLVVRDGAIFCRVESEPVTATG